MGGLSDKSFMILPGFLVKIIPGQGYDKIVVDTPYRTTALTTIINSD